MESANLGAWYSFRYRRFRWVFVSNTTFMFAMFAQMVVRSILAFEITGSALALGLINLAVAFPMIVVSPLGGVVADRLDRRTLIVAGQGMLLINEAAVLVLLVAGLLNFWVLFASVTVMGAAFPIIMPARQAVIVSIVGREGLGNAIALGTGSMNAARVAGPVTGGVLVAVGGIEGAYAVAVVLYAVALVTISRIGPAPAEGRVGNKAFFGEMKEGFVLAWDNHHLHALLVVGIIPSLLAMPFQSLLVVFTEEEWGVGETGFGILQAVAGLGGVGGSLVMAYVGESGRPLRMMLSTGLLFTGFLFLFALSPWYLAALPLVAIANLFAALFQTSNMTATQAIIPDAIRGRVMALMMMTFGLTPLGTVPVAAAADVWGAPIAIAAAAVVTALLTVVFFASSGALRSLDRAVAESRALAVSGAGREQAGEGRPTAGAAHAPARLRP